MAKNMVARLGGERASVVGFGATSPLRTAMHQARADGTLYFCTESRCVHVGAVPSSVLPSALDTAALCGGRVASIAACTSRAGSRW